MCVVLAPICITDGGVNGEAVNNQTGFVFPVSVEVVRGNLNGYIAIAGHGVTIAWKFNIHLDSSIHIRFLKKW